MFVIATNGICLAVVEIDNPYAEKLKDGFARLPIFKVGKSEMVEIDNMGASITAEIRRDDGLPDPPNIWPIVNKAKLQLVSGAFVAARIQPKYLTPASNLLGALFPDSKTGFELILPTTEAGTPFVLRKEGMVHDGWTGKVKRKQNLQAVVIIMPVVP